MLRLPSMVLVALLVALGSYLFLLPSGSQQQARPEAGGKVGAIRDHRTATSTGQNGATARLAWATQARPRLIPGSVGNPPRHPRRAIVRRVAATLLRLPTPLPARSLRVPILMYHHIAPFPVAGDLYPGLTVTNADFTAQLAYLGRHGYHTITLRQVFGALYGGRALPAHPIVLTFDDGYEDNYTYALPILRRAHDVGEFNIISSYVGIMVGINNYMSWPQIKRLVAAGMEIGSHTVDHQDLGLLPEDKVRFELRDSRNILQRTLGIPVQFLAYPSGEPFKSGSAGARALLLKLLPTYGYVGAVLDGPLTSSTQDAQAPFQLERIRVSGGEGIDDFAASLQS